MRISTLRHGDTELHRESTLCSSFPLYPCLRAGAEALAQAYGKEV